MDDQDLCYFIIIDVDNCVLGYLICCDVCGNIGVVEDMVCFFIMNVDLDENLCVVFFKMYKYSISWMLVIVNDGSYVGEVMQDFIVSYLSFGKLCGMVMVV